MASTVGESSNAAADGDARGLLKDAVLSRLAETRNVAQFVSFSPGAEPALRFAAIRDLPGRPETVEAAVEACLARTEEGQVNVRSFLPDQPKSHEFIYGLRTVPDAAAAVRRLAATGLYTIVNETIDIHDGGVSGVSFGGVIEFAPGDTPRAVEKPGTAAFAYEVGTDMLETVYGFRPHIPDDPSLRVEWSIHPIRRGYRSDHTIVWEEEHYEPTTLTATPVWPNRFSQFIGDKAFGLLVADAVGLKVPRTTLVARHVAPFSFGRPTGSGEYWIRTAPTEQVPGKFTTHRGWLDPYRLLANEDPAGTAIASVLAQEGVTAAYSGVAAGEDGGTLLIEGVQGYGDSFMLGTSRPTNIPQQVRADVERAYDIAAAALGAARFEWVHDGAQTWIVQLHRGGLPGRGRTIFPGAAVNEHRFEVGRGLEELRQLIAEVEGTGDGIVLVGDAGVTSHLGDVLRRARIPSRIARS